MDKKSNLFGEFEELTTAQWFSDIEGYLKGKSLESLDWELEEAVHLKPFYRKEDTIAVQLAHQSNRSQNDWAVCEYIVVEQVEEANKLALKALEKGANALEFVLSDNFEASQIALLLKDIHLSMLHLHLSKVEATELLPLLQVLSELKGSSDLQGSLNFGDKDSPEVLAEALRFSQQHFPKFSLLVFQKKGATITETIAQNLFSASEQLRNLASAGFRLDQLLPQCYTRFWVANNYFAELAKIRAYTKLWGAMLEAYGLEVESPKIYVQTLSAATEDKYWNMITATTQVMAAAIAGADTIVVCPSDGLESKNVFTKRIARNVQHILQSESHLDKVLDPAAGSYYIENLTQQIAKKAWNRFVELNH